MTTHTHPNVYLMHRYDQEKIKNKPQIETWFPHKDYPDLDEDIAYQVLDTIHTRILQPQGAAMKRTPTGAGACLLEHMLPISDDQKPYKYYPLPDGIQSVIRAGMAHASTQFFPQDREIESIYCYDARAAWLSTCRQVPVYFGDLADLVHDTRSEYVERQIGFYKATVTVPQDWHHIGLAPLKRKNMRDASYPNKAGDTWETWLDGAEVALCLEHGWKVEIQQRILFPKGSAKKYDPLKDWSLLLNAAIEAIGDQPRGPNATRQKLARAALRAMGLYTIGWLHNRGEEVTRIVHAGERTPVDIPMWASFKVNDDGDKVYTYSEAHADLRGKWNQPHMQAHIVAKWRVRMHRLILGDPQRGIPPIPFEDIIAIKTDAIYVNQWQPQIPDDGRVGQFRVKERALSIPPGTPAPANFVQLRRLMHPVAVPPTLGVASRA